MNFIRSVKKVVDKTNLAFVVVVVLFLLLSF